MTFPGSCLPCFPGSPCLSLPSFLFACCLFRARLARLARVRIVSVLVVLAVFAVLARFISSSSFFMFFMLVVFKLLTTLSSLSFLVIFVELLCYHACSTCPACVLVCLSARLRLLVFVCSSSSCAHRLRAFVVFMCLLSSCTRRACRACRLSARSFPELRSRRRGVKFWSWSRDSFGIA